MCNTSNVSFKYLMEQSHAEQSHAKQTTFGNFILFECDNYLIYGFGLHKYYIFDSFGVFVYSAPRNVNLQLLSAEPSRLIIHYVELLLDYQNSSRFTIVKSRIHNKDGALYNNGAVMISQNKHIDILICQRVGYGWTSELIKATKTFSRK